MKKTKTIKFPNGAKVDFNEDPSGFPYQSGYASEVRKDKKPKSMVITRNATLDDLQKNSDAIIGTVQENLRRQKKALEKRMDDMDMENNIVLENRWMQIYKDFNLEHLEESLFKKIEEEDACLLILIQRVAKQQKACFKKISDHSGRIKDLENGCDNLIDQMNENNLTFVNDLNHNFRLLRSSIKWRDRIIFGLVVILVVSRFI